MYQTRHDFGLLAMRLAIGTVFFLHGIGKLAAIGPFASGIGGFAGFLATLGVPAPMLFAWVVAIVETFGGLAILLGVLTRYAAVFTTIDMAAATVLVHLPNGYPVSQGGFELTLLLGVASIGFVLLGAGGLSLEHALTGSERDFPRFGRAERPRV
ncbi:DoxX family protein [Natronomonas sp. EA1]|uniref:DoxX family protein n=1 Tax=Natronomonas sp. EA1 TaxID=3421655 RepID=UPI003EBDC1B9